MENSRTETNVFYVSFLLNSAADSIQAWRGSNEELFFPSKSRLNPNELDIFFPLSYIFWDLNRQLSSVDINLSLGDSWHDAMSINSCPQNFHNFEYNKHSAVIWWPHLRLTECFLKTIRNSPVFELQHFYNLETIIRHEQTRKIWIQFSSIMIYSISSSYV